MFGQVLIGMNHCNDGYEFLLERRLKELSPSLSASFRNIVFIMQEILDRNDSVFPTFTDHTIRHSLLVLEFSNRIIGHDNLAKMNEDEIFILMCAAYMHDFGMTIDAKRFEQFRHGIVPEDFFDTHPDYSIRDAIRKYHNEFSRLMVLQYAGIFDFQNEDYAYCIAQVCCGHRKKDLYDINEYNPEYRLSNGNTVCLSYLASLLRLADELDIAMNRNMPQAYAEHWDNIHFRQHFAIKRLEIEDDRFTAEIQTGEEAVLQECISVINKLNDTIRYCVDVTEKTNRFTISQKYVEMSVNRTDKRTAVILDTDSGTDDAAALSMIRFMGDFAPDFIVATPGNTNLDQALRNVIILKHMFGFSGTVVRGMDADKTEETDYKNDFHGLDGFADISAQTAEKLKISEEDFGDYITLDEMKARLSSFDSVVYISICPLNTFSALYGDGNIRDRISGLYIMGGGINEFNCPNNTEFNFAQSPSSAAELLNTGLDITLFPLDLTNHQRISEDEINILEAHGAMPEMITALRCNLRSNMRYNGINGAVMHDSMPMLYLIRPDCFTVRETKIACDEYGAIFETADGCPVKIAEKARDGLLMEYVRRAL